MASICLFGASGSAMPGEFLQAAEDLGRAIYANGYDFVFGGGANGIMGAAARGAKEAGARVHGIIPDHLNLDGHVYSLCDELEITEDLRDRAARMVESSDAFICLPGGLGTLYELFEVLVLKQLYQHDKPIVLLNTNGYYDTLLGFLTELIDRGACLLECASLYSIAATPEEALKQIVEYQPPQRSGLLTTEAPK